MADGPSQITDIGGLPYGEKQNVENLAAEGGVSLGTKGGTDVPSGPARIAPQPPGNLNIGGASDFIMNAGSQGNLASDGLSFGQGMGPAPLPMSELEQQRKGALDDALEIYSKTKIPAVKAAAAQVIRGAVISQLQGDEDDR